jgi:acetyl esterase/lipase
MGLVLPLWPDGAIHNLTWDLPEEDTILPNGLPAVRNVSQPTLSVFLPDPAVANGLGMVVCPGGANHFLAYDHEGLKVAGWLNARGIAAFMLKYRVWPTGDDFPACIGENMRDRARKEMIDNTIQPLAARDGLQAIRVVRKNAAEWGVAPNRIGIMGFSAGGCLTTMVAEQYGPESRPDFAAPIYPAPAPDAPVPVDAPPLFLLTAGDDAMAAPVCIKLYEKWRAAGHPAELHIYAAGGHGFGMNPLGLPVDSWIELLGDWLDGLAVNQ